MPSTAYIETLWPSQPDIRYKALRATVLLLLGSGLLTLSAKIQVPFWPVPMTMQTFAIMVLGAALGARLGAAAVVLYIMEGMVGLPVFANTPPQVPSPAYLMGPTGGFLASFVVAAFMIGFVADRGWLKKPFLFASVLIIANVLILALGGLWMALFAKLASGATGMGFENAYLKGIEPFLLSTVFKTMLAALALPLLAQVFTKFKK